MNTDIEKNIPDLFSILKCQSDSYSEADKENISKVFNLNTVEIENFLNKISNINLDEKISLSKYEKLKKNNILTVPYKHINEYRDYFNNKSSRKNYTSLLYNIKRSFIEKSKVNKNRISFKDMITLSNLKRETKLFNLNNINTYKLNSIIRKYAILEILSIWKENGYINSAIVDNVQNNGYCTRIAASIKKPVERITEDVLKNLSYKNEPIKISLLFLKVKNPYGKRKESSVDFTYKYSINSDPSLYRHLVTIGKNNFVPSNTHDLTLTPKSMFNNFRLSELSFDIITRSVYYMLTESMRTFSRIVEESGNRTDLLIENTLYDSICDHFHYRRVDLYDDIAVNAAINELQFVIDITKSGCLFYADDCVTDINFGPIAWNMMNYNMFDIYKDKLQSLALKSVRYTKFLNKQISKKNVNITIDKFIYFLSSSPLNNRAYFSTNTYISHLSTFMSSSKMFFALSNININKKKVNVFLPFLIYMYYVYYISYSSGSRYRANFLKFEIMNKKFDSESDYNNYVDLKVEEFKQICSRDGIDNDYSSKEHLANDCIYYINFSYIEFLKYWNENVVNIDFDENDKLLFVRHYNDLIMSFINLLDCELLSENCKQFMILNDILYKFDEERTSV